MTEPRSLVERSVDGAPIPWFEIPDWGDQLGLVAGVTGRGDPVDPFDLGLASHQPIRAVLDRWRRIQAFFPSFSGIVIARQIHGGQVRWHEAPQGWCVVEGADGHACRTAGVLLAVSLADCIPIYLVDRATGAIALLHSGWRGTAAGILGAGIRELVARAGSKPKDLLVHVGVGICGDCYEVSADVASACGQPTVAGVPRQLDLRRVIADQAAAQGVGEITVSSWCSAHDRVHFMSHRGSGGADGRMVALLGIRN